jgi:hypothetical protein
MIDEFLTFFIAGNLIYFIENIHVFIKLTM